MEFFALNLYNFDESSQIQDSSRKKCRMSAKEQPVLGLSSRSHLHESIITFWFQIVSFLPAKRSPEKPRNDSMNKENKGLSEEDFVSLLAKHSSRVMSFIRILTLNHPQDAEEIFQSTCLVMWQKFPTYEDGNFAAWACTIARYETLKLRESKRRVKVLSDETIELLAEAAMPISAELGDRRNALSNCIKQLPSADRDLIRQRYFDGLSVLDISQRMGASTHKIYRALSKAHGVLSRCIQLSVHEASS